MTRFQNDSAQNYAVTNKIPEIFDLSTSPHLGRVFLQNLASLWLPLAADPDKFSLKELFTIGYAHWFSVKNCQERLKLEKDPDYEPEWAGSFSLNECTRHLNERWHPLFKFNKKYVARCFKNYLHHDLIEIDPGVSPVDAREKRYRPTLRLDEMTIKLFAPVSLAANLMTAQRRIEINQANVQGLAAAIDALLGLQPDFHQPHEGESSGDGVHVKGITPRTVNMAAASSEKRRPNGFSSQIAQTSVPAWKPAYGKPKN
ncbi:MAG: hypothetical protein CMI60_12560 [Parvibaculum sp.]|nr:hypothetical protein [Parvibaculum sp.]